MNRNRLIAMISAVLAGLILFKGAVTFVCAPNEPNSVANVISNIVAPAPTANPIAEKPDPLSWGPFINDIGLSIPTIATVAVYFQLPLSLGISTLNMVLMYLTFFIGRLTLAIGRTTLLQGVCTSLSYLNTYS